MGQRAIGSIIYVGDNMSLMAPRHATGMKLNLRYESNTGKWFVDVVGIDNYLDTVIGANRRHVAIQVIKITPGSRSIKRVDKKKGTYNAKERKPADSNFRVNVQVNKNFINGYATTSGINNIEVTHLMRHLIYYDNYFSRHALFSNLYSRVGYWYRKYKLCIQINNVYYASTDTIYIRTYYDGHLEDGEGYYDVESPYQIDVYEY